MYNEIEGWDAARRTRPVRPAGPVVNTGAKGGASVVKFEPGIWQDWLNALLGLWVAVQPWVLGYAENKAALWASVIAGVLVIIFSLWSQSQHHGTAQHS
ncbi:MAG TPA: SPW repeat protein [Bacillota bacterium]